MTINAEESLCTDSLEETARKARMGDGMEMKRRNAGKDSTQTPLSKRIARNAKEIEYFAGSLTRFLSQRKTNQNQANVPFVDPTQSGD